MKQITINYHNIGYNHYIMIPSTFTYTFHLNETTDNIKDLFKDIFKGYPVELFINHKYLSDTISISNIINTHILACSPLFILSEKVESWRREFESYESVRIKYNLLKEVWPKIYNKNALEYLLPQNIAQFYIFINEGCCYHNGCQPDIYIVWGKDIDQGRELYVTFKAESKIVNIYTINNDDADENYLDADIHINDIESIAKNIRDCLEYVY